MSSEKQKELQRKWYLDNKERLLSKAKELYKDNPEILIADKKRKKHKYNTDPEYRAKEILRKTIYYKQRYNTDLNFRLICNLRIRLTQAIKKNFKVGSAVRDLGCSVDFLKQYLESKFLPGMSWDNYGSYWEIDHIFPLSQFNLDDKEQFLKAVHYTNLQSLTVSDNRSKGIKLDY